MFEGWKLKDNTKNVSQRAISKGFQKLYRIVYVLLAWALFRLIEIGETIMANVYCTQDFEVILCERIRSIKMNWKQLEANGNGFLKKVLDSKKIIDFDFQR